MLQTGLILKLSNALIAWFLSLGMLGASHVSDYFVVLLSLLICEPFILREEKSGMPKSGTMAARSPAGLPPKRGVKLSTTRDSLPKFGGTSDI